MANHNLGTDELLALLRDSSLKSESIVEEMECAGCTSPSAGEVTKARAALASLAADSPAQDLAAEVLDLPDLLSAALARAAGEAGKQDLLVELATSKKKALAKEAKRELQRLKQKGVQVKELKLQGAPVLKPQPEAEAPPCYASSIDAYGERAIWWARPSRSGVEVVQAVVSDFKGILAIDALGLSRRSFREFIKRLPQKGVVSTAEISPGHARALIARAAEDGSRNGFSPPPSYAEALRILGPVPVPPPPSPGAQVDFGSDGELPHALAAAALFTDPLFLSWIPEEEALRSFAAKVDELAASQLYIDDAQRAEAFKRLSEEAAESYFTPQRRARYGSRLLEMAHVLAQDGRLDAARASLATSHTLEQDAKSPFCSALFTHAVARKFAEETGAGSLPDAPQEQGQLIQAP